MKQFLVCVVAVAFAGGEKLNASLILDWSPDTTGEIISLRSGVNSNISYVQPYLDRVVFDYDVSISGMDLYTSLSPNILAEVGTQVIINVWEDFSGHPGREFGVGVHRFESEISIIDDEGIVLSSRDSVPYVNPQGVEIFFDDVRLFSDFGDNSFILPANTPLWIGMTGKDIDIGFLYTVDSASPYGDNEYVRLVDEAGTIPWGIRPAGDVAFRLHGDVGSSIDRRLPVFPSIEPTPVPEPSAYGLIGVLALVGLVARRYYIRRSRMAS